MTKTKFFQLSFPIFFLVAMGIFLSFQHVNAAPVATATTASAPAMTMPGVEYYFNNSITPDMLTAAGYSDVTVQPPLASDHFAPPVYYFRVKEAAPAKDGWGSNSNLVAVLVRPKLSPDWQYNNGKMEARTIAGRTQIRFTTAKNYIVVTGPDAEKTTALANDLSLLF